MLKQDGTLCSFSLCIEQVQRSCETLRSEVTAVQHKPTVCRVLMQY
ncbi:hypothetical protein ES332_D08G000400v1 [Gossypium tomentosum]|uniref:tRNA (adenine(58)-N(1))-methyltransferase catalytic subunit TRM61 C-terminal domain-containing protein n=1 Tax=Gossypium tomentosum TaxID=34277 RepID=A0A5D2JNZ2_GOSTO|nr:hypothetical protein ES332_D08G000400v1 [Gossypium tomentosum]